MDRRLRNWLAEQILEALREGVPFEADVPEGDPLPEAVTRRAARARRASERAVREVGAAPSIDVASPPSEAELAWALSAAAILFDEALFFEVHEILEPPWQRAEGEVRGFLQGLIQVAVAFHHASTGNRRGALSLLREGAARLAPHRPAAWGIELSEFCHDADRAAHELLDAPESALVDPPQLASIPRLVVTR